MMRLFAIVALWMGVAGAAWGAEVRWCSITGRAGNDLAYPEIARRARVFGVVKSRLTFMPTGEVRSVERISGPELLFSAVKQQILRWRIRTDATGDGACQAGVTVAFNLDDFAQWRNPDEEKQELPTALKLVVEGESFPVEVIDTTNDPVMRRRSTRAR